MVKQNGNLVHDNLTLQLQVQQLKEELYDMKGKLERTESRKKLPYIHRTKTTKTDLKERKDESNSKRPLSIKHSKLNVQKTTKKQENIETREVVSGNNNSTQTPLVTVLPPKEGFFADDEISEYKSLITNNFDSLDLVQISENPSQVSNEYISSLTSSRQVIRTQSAPEIVSSSRFPFMK